MSSVHCVVVWEWQCEARDGDGGGGWLPHAPGVSRALERAHGKQLTRVVLGDADPALLGHYVNLTTLMQYSDEPDSCGCPVRRACYAPASAAGRGARWEWARVPPQRRHQLCYQPLPMDMQCLIEESWRAGSPSVSLNGWAVCLARLLARGPTGVRLLRRQHAPPYPLTRVVGNGGTQRTPVEGRRPRIPQQHTGSSVQSVQSVQSAVSVHSAQSVHSTHSAQSAHSAHSAQSMHAAQPVQSAQSTRGGARSASPRERKPGLARQILHNLNIFSTNTTRAPPPDAKRLWERDGARESERDGDGEETRERRHSVDTVSTYLSHESKESLPRGSVAELLDCSAGSDDVFDPPRPPAPAPAVAVARPRPPAPLPSPLSPPAAKPAVSHDGEDMDCILGPEPWWRSLTGTVRGVSRPQWGAVCPACMRALAPSGPAGNPGAAGPACVAFAACQHMMHLHCLRAHLDKLYSNGEPLTIECLVCGAVYGSDTPAEAEPRASGEQPPGSMAWALQPAALPTHPDRPAILVTYNFQSGRQGPSHPWPGAPYYAVGFPRHTVLPDTPLGRQVLSVLRALWERRLLFGVSASQTTGREHVVAWRAPPPPADRRHYGGPPAEADRRLRRDLRRLEALLPPDHDRVLCDPV